MTEWEPATDAELAMRDALRTDDQESYFRILAGADLLLPVSADALAGRTPLGWGTWSSGGRTHVLAFTSPSALQACLADYAGSARRVEYAELAATWPNLEWWLAINPGLPIEGYLPAWFVAQLARGDVRLPARVPDSDAAPAEHGSGADGPHAPAGPPAPAAVASAAPAAASRAVPAERVPGTVLPSGLPARVRPAGQQPVAVPAGQQPVAVPAAAGSSTTTSAPVVPAAYRPPDVPASSVSHGGPTAAEHVTQAGDSGPRRFDAAAAFSAPSGPQSGGSMAGRPGPAPAAHDHAAYGDGGRPQPEESPSGQHPTGQNQAPWQQAAQPGQAQSGHNQVGSQPAVPAAGGPLPRRPVTPPSERPTSMAAAAQAIAGARAPQPVPAARVVPPVVPPVVPGADPSRPGADPSSPTPVPGGAAPPESVRPPVSAPGRHPGSAPGAPPGPPAGGSAPDDDFLPANEVEQDLLNAADGGSTDIFLSTLLLATVLVPVGPDSRAGSAPGQPGFGYRTEDHQGETFLVVFTSTDRLAEHYAAPVHTVGIRFFELIRGWPDPSWSFAVNPGSPVGAKLPGAQVVALASWATEAGLGADGAPADIRHRPAHPVAIPAPRSQASEATGQHPTIMQKTVPPEQVGYFLERGYDRVSGFVHRANEVEHLRTPAELHAALGLGYAGSPYRADAEEAYLLRWPAYRPSLYRIPYGGQNEHALRAMDGWVIERAPFRGNGFAPGDSRDVIAEFKVDSARLPQGAELWRIDSDGAEQMIAVFDGDGPVWRRVGGQ